MDFVVGPVSDFSDVTITSIASGELLKWNGSAWINNTLAEAGIAAASHTHAAADVTSGTFADARISESSVTRHEAALSIAKSQITSTIPDVTGTPANNQLAVWTDADTLEGDGDLTWDGATLSIAGDGATNYPLEVFQSGAGQQVAFFRNATDAVSFAIESPGSPSVRIFRHV